MVQMQWARQHLTHRQNWSYVVFSDESRFNVSNADGRCWVLHERFSTNCVLERHQFEGGGVIVWGAIYTNLWSQLVVLNGTLTARRFVDEIMQPVLVPLMQKHMQGNGLIFQQNNACAHTARLTKNFFQGTPSTSLIGPLYPQTWIQSSICRTSWWDVCESPASASASKSARIRENLVGG